jgi:hypothetical protein
MAAMASMAVNFVGSHKRRWRHIDCAGPAFGLARACVHRRLRARARVRARGQRYRHGRRGVFVAVWRCADAQHVSRQPVRAAQLPAAGAAVRGLAVRGLSDDTTPGLKTAQRPLQARDALSLRSDRTRPERFGERYVRATPYVRTSAVKKTAPTMRGQRLTSGACGIDHGGVATGLVGSPAPGRWPASARCGTHGRTHQRWRPGSRLPDA